MTDDERRALVADLVFEVMGLEMPCPREPTPSGGSGQYWKVGHRMMHDNDEHIAIAIGVFWDHWRRLEARRLIQERGLPAELVRAAWGVGLLGALGDPERDRGVRQERPAAGRHVEPEPLALRRLVLDDRALLVDPQVVGLDLVKAVRAVGWADRH